MIGAVVSQPIVYVFAIEVRISGCYYTIDG